jgi:hypothetical protein
LNIAQNKNELQTKERNKENGKGFGINSLFEFLNDYYKNKLLFRININPILLKKKNTRYY